MDKKHSVTNEEIKTAITNARFAYEQRALKPLVDELPNSEKAYLIDHGIIASPERGKVMFCVPYLADYVKRDEHVSDAITVARKRKV